MRVSTDEFRSWLGHAGLLAITVFASLAPLPAPAANGSPELIPRCSGPFRLCGYIEESSHQEHIPPRFEVARPFSEGLASVRIDGFYGFIDTAGEIVIAPRFQNAGSFSREYAEVRLDNASGIINRSGELVIAPRFRRIIPFSGDTFLAEPLREGQQNSPLTERKLGAFNDFSSFTSMQGAGLFHIQRGWLSDQNLKFARFDKPERGLIWAGKSIGRHEYLWGLLRSDGTWQVSPRYHHVQQLSETHAVVAATPNNAPSSQPRLDHQRWGAVDRDGKLVVPLKFAHLRYWRGGYGQAREAQPYKPDGTPSKSREGIVRADGTLLADRYFDEIDIDQQGGLPRGRIGKTWHSVEPDGSLVPDQLDGTPLLQCPGGLSVIRRGESVEFRVPGNGRPVGPFDMKHVLGQECPGPFSAQRHGKWFVVLENGSVLGGKNGFENSYSFSGDHAAVKVDGKWGIIDRAGAFTVKPGFETLRPTGKGLFTVEDADDRYLISAYGDRVEVPTAELTAEQALTCAGGLRFFEREGLWGFQDKDGKTVIEPRFRALSCFEHGISWAAAPDAKVWCAIGPNGQRRSGIECREAYHPRASSHYFPETFSSDPYESSVLWNRALLEYRARKRDNAPKWIGDGYRGSGSFDAK